MFKERKLIVVTALVSASVISFINYFISNTIETVESNDEMLFVNSQNICNDILDTSENDFPFDYIVEEESEVLAKLDLYSLKRKNTIATEYILNKEGVPSLKELNELSRIYSIPDNLLYSLMLKESGGDLIAQSHKQARGLFQFVPKTARQFGLVVNDELDERIDPWKSADASARYLAWIFTYFHSEIDRANIDNYKYVLAAYNAGLSKVKKAGKLSIPNYKETMDYVYIVMGHAKGDLHLIEKGEHLYKIASSYNIKRSELKKMNDGIKQENLIAGRYLLINKESFDQHHVVDKGDSLYAIAKSHRVSINQLKITNNLTDNLIRIGQKIRIPF